MAPTSERLGAGRKAQGHSDGLSVMSASDLPGYLTYGEFDLTFFTELLCRAAAFRKGLDGSADSLSGGGGDTSAMRDMLREASSDLCFMDAGSGVGRLVHAALLTGSFRQVVGVEIVETLHQLAVDATERLLSPEVDAVDEGDIRLRCCDLNSKEAKLHEADVLFCYSSAMAAFGDGYLSEFSGTIGTRTRPGSVVITTDRRLLSEGQPWEMELLYEVEGPNRECGGTSSAYIWRVNESLFAGGGGSCDDDDDDDDDGTEVAFVSSSSRREVLQQSTGGAAAAALAVLLAPAVPLPPPFSSSSSSSSSSSAAFAMAPGDGFPVVKSSDEWVASLTPQQHFILREGGTEAPNSSPLVREARPGEYRCAGCGGALFSSAAKFESRTGWPTFAQTIRPEAVQIASAAPASGGGSSLGGAPLPDRRPSWLSAASEALVGAPFVCAACGSAIGERFSDGAAYPGTAAMRTGKRYCANGAALAFAPETTSAENSVSGRSTLVMGDASDMAASNSRQDYEWHMRDGGLRSI